MMFIVDTEALREKMGGRRYTITKLAKTANVDRNTMRCYLEHPEKFPYPVMQKIADEFELSYEEAKEIFFKQKLT